MTLALFIAFFKSVEAKPYGHIFVADSKGVHPIVYEKVEVYAVTEGDIFLVKLTHCLSCEHLYYPNLAKVFGCMHNPI